jgi:Rps23 Pro-64 3,4-dihydroxylase Tpa1-like proline 4-hydroxylase
MKISHYKTPFYHVIIDNFFTNEEIVEIHNEIITIQKSQSILTIREDDKHHYDLLHKNKTSSYCLDALYEGQRQKSSILRLVTKVYSLNFEDHKNPFLNYIPISNQDMTYVNVYKNGSSYDAHQDGAVLTFLYVFYDEPRAYIGGNLIFPNYEYEPELLNNSLIIFPSYELHKVTEMVAEDHVGRYSINQRIWIKA